MSQGKRKITVELPLSGVMSDALDDLRDSELARHVRGIQREMLLAMRSILDAGIAFLEEDEEEGEGKPKQGKKADTQ